MKKSRKQIFDEAFEKAKVDFKMQHFLKEGNHPRVVMPIEFILGEDSASKQRDAYNGRRE
jgi:hypothetical protein